jgi:dATP pyrophosphohydrolase
MGATHIEVYLFRRAPRIQLLLLRRSGHDSLPGVWQPVTGRIHAREKALAAAAREVREESGLAPSRWWRLEHVVSYVNPLTDELRVVPLFAAEVELLSRVRLSDEHDAYRWVTPAAAAPLVLWDTQRAALRALRRQVLGPARLAAALEIPVTHASRPRPVAPRRRRTRGTRRTRG